MKTALITGATNGIGLYAARKIAEQGFRTIVHGRSQSLLDSTVEDISKAIQKLFDSSFAKKINNMEKPYGNGGSAKSIVKIIASTSINGILKKQFFDINFYNE